MPHKCHQHTPVSYRLVIKVANPVVKGVVRAKCIPA